MHYGFQRDGWVVVEEDEEVEEACSELVREDFELDSLDYHGYNVLL